MDKGLYMSKSVHKSYTRNIFPVVTVGYSPICNYYN